MPNHPTFKYHPNAYQDGTFIHEKGICQCCGKETDCYINMMYCSDDIDCICPECVDSGEAARKFDGSFVDDADRIIGNPIKTMELFKKTPGYDSWQGEYWRTCCGDYCEYLGDCGYEDLERLGITEEVVTEMNQMHGFKTNPKDIQAKGHISGYLFRCLHCGKYHIWTDAD